MSNGIFLTFEGIDGCGKSTQVLRIAKILAERGVAYRQSREPGGTIISEKIRSILIDPDHSEMHNSCEVLLYLAARAQHVQEVIQPALAAGEVVLCDRFELATFAYQGYGRHGDLNALMALNRFATGGVKPHHTFVFDIDADTAHARLVSRQKNADRLEGLGREFFVKVRAGYKTMATEDATRCTVINGAQDPDVITRQVMERIDALWLPSAASL